MNDLTLALDYASVSSRIQAFAEQARFEQEYLVVVGTRR